MTDLDQARNLLGMAEKDLRALQGMQDVQVFSSEVFGFHVQQAVEKTLKAWLCCLGIAFPRIHDLDELAAMLEKAGRPIPDSPVRESPAPHYAGSFGDQRPRRGRGRPR